MRHDARIPRPSLATVLAVLTWAEAARADVVFSNLGPGDEWNHTSAYVLRGPQGDGTSPAGGKAMQFRPTFQAEFTSVELALGSGLIPGTNRIVVELRADAQGQPGAVLESFAFENLPYLYSPTQTLSVGTSVSRPVLEANTTYWIAAFPGAADTSGGWNWSSPLQTGIWAASADGTTWEFNPFGRTEIAAFRVNGTSVVPEPGTLALCGVGGSLLLAVRRRRSRHDFSRRTGVVYSR